jgi:chemotaxis protein MotA
MDFATIIGLSLGVLILAISLVIGEVPVSILFKPEALLIVVGGTATAVLISFSAATLQSALKGMRKCFYVEPFDLSECVNYVTQISSFVRSNGLLSLQNFLQGIELPFLQKGLSLLVDNRPESFIRESLSTEIEISFREDMDHARVFEAAGGFAPTMGLIGAVIGLIHVVQTFHDPVALGKGVASSFSSTLYGVALSNLFLLPIAGKLRQIARDAWFQKTLLLEGILSIRMGEHPLILEEKLNAYVKNSSIPEAQSGAVTGYSSVETDQADWKIPLGV